MVELSTVFVWFDRIRSQRGGEVIIEGKRAVPSLRAKTLEPLIVSRLSHLGLNSSPEEEVSPSVSSFPENMSGSEVNGASVPFKRYARLMAESGSRQTELRRANAKWPYWKREGEEVLSPLL